MSREASPNFRNVGGKMRKIVRWEDENLRGAGEIARKFVYLQSMDRFPLDSSKVYYSTDLLTLECEDGEKTLMLGEWINTDPVRIHRMAVREKSIQLDNFELFLPLMSKLRRADPDYYKKIMGLQLIIDFPGYPTGIEARIPFDTDPVGFYKWWRKGKHEDKLHVSLGNQMRLFQKVHKIEPKILLKKDFQILGI